MADLPPVTTGIHHIAVRVEDWDASLRVYEALGFHLKMEWLGSGAHTIRVGLLEASDGSCIEFFSRTEQCRDVSWSELPLKSEIPHLCLRTDDVSRGFAVATAAGLKIVQEPVEVTLRATTGQGNVPVRLCFFEGPGGELVELIEGIPTDLPEA